MANYAPAPVAMLLFAVFVGQCSAFLVTSPVALSKSASMFVRPASQSLPSRHVHKQSVISSRGMRKLCMSFDADDILKRMGTSEAQKANDVDNTSANQWKLFKSLCEGKWSGMWLTYDAMGSQIDDIRVDVSLDVADGGNAANHVQSFYIGQVSSECDRCTDSIETKILPVGAYTEGNIRKHVVIGPGLVNGPSVLRSGAMTTELVLRVTNGRVRVTYQHAPVRLADTPEELPPDALKIFRVVVAREILGNNPPTPAVEQSYESDHDGPVFWRGVSPFKWHALWGGNSWTYGQQQGYQMWEVPSVEEVDAWHGRPRGDDPNVWTLQLPGGILLQCPVLVRQGEVETFRLAWLPADEELRRCEARIVALKEDQDDGSGMIRFLPPELVFGRVDALSRLGNLPDVPVLVDAPEE